MKPRRAVTQAPEGYEVGQSRTGKTYEIQMSPEQVDAFCRMKGALRAGETFLAPGCYIPAMDAVVIPKRNEWPSKREWNDLRAHEWAHADGWPGDHPNVAKNIFAEQPMPKTAGNVFRGR